VNDRLPERSDGAKRQELAKQLGEKNKKEGEAFLAGNKTKEGVKTLHERPAIQGDQGGDGKETEGHGHRDDSISGDPYGWARI